MDPKNGGPCQGVRNSVAEITKLGNVHEVACLDEKDASFLKSDNFKIYTFGPAISPWRYSPSVLPWLKENLCNYDSIIIHGIWLYISYATYQAINYLERNSKKLKVPKLFIMTHGMLDPYFQKSEERKWKAIRNSLYWAFIESKVIERADAILFTTEEERQLATTTFDRYRPRKTVNVGYGIQPPPVLETQVLDDFYSKHTFLKGHPYILYLSRIHQKKGLDLLLHAYHRLFQHYPKETIPNIFIVGPGWESSFGQQIKSEIDGNENLRNKVFTSNMLLGDDKWAAFYNSSAFILPSHQENFGIVVAEALACKKLTLITNKVNIYKDIVDRNAGLVAEDTDEGIYNMLFNFVNLGIEVQQSMGMNAFKAYTELYTVQVWVNTLLNTIR